MLENDKLRLAAIGTGSLGRHHARNYAELAAENEIEFIGICDTAPATARVISEKYGCVSFADPRQLFDKVDAVSIATPTETHCDIACSFLERGIHVLVEKPMAITTDEADKMTAAAATGSAKLMIGHLERYNPAMVALKPHITTPLYFEIHRVSPFPDRSLDVDVVLDVMIHDLDAVQWMVGEDVGVSAISAVGIPVISDKVDAANARIEFANGAVANITSSRVGHEKVRKTRFFQKGSYVVLDYAAKYAAITTLDSDDPHSFAGISIQKLDIADTEPLRAEINDFLACIRNDTAPPISGADGRRALALATGILDRIEAHRQFLDV